MLLRLKVEIIRYRLKPFVALIMTNIYLRLLGSKVKNLFVKKVTFVVGISGTSFANSLDKSDVTNYVQKWKSCLRMKTIIRTTAPVQTLVGELLKLNLSFKTDQARVIDSSFFVCSKRRRALPTVSRRPA